MFKYANGSLTNANFWQIKEKSTDAYIQSVVN